MVMVLFEGVIIVGRRYCYPERLRASDRVSQPTANALLPVSEALLKPVAAAASDVGCRRWLSACRWVISHNGSFDENKMTFVKFAEGLSTYFSIALASHYNNLFLFFSKQSGTHC